MKLLNSLKSHNRAISIVLSEAFSYSANQKSHTVRYAATQEIYRLKQFYSWLKNRTTRQWIIYSGVTCGLAILMLVGLIAVFLTPKNHSYSFASDNCFFNPLVFPKTIDLSGTDAFQTILESSLSIGNTPLVSTTTCVEITKITDAESDNTINLKSPLQLQKTISLTPENMPQITAYDDILKPVSLDAVLLYSLDQQDKTFSYVLQINDTKTDCILNTVTLGCPLLNQSLLQGKTYEYTLHRVLNNSSTEVMSSSITTLDSVVITVGSVAQNEMIYDMPKSFSFTANKSLKSVTGVSLRSSENLTYYIMTTEINDTNLTLSLTEDLPRNTSFTLTIQYVESTDGAYMYEPYSLLFRTSAGPQVQGIDIGNYKVSPSASITLTFDIELDQNQSISEYISLSTSNGIIPSSISIQNNSLTILPSISIGVCTTFTVNVKDGIKNKFGVSGNSAWNLQSRTTCQQSFSIGTSVQGRSITGYKFGSGPIKILFVGGMHGDEKSSVRTLSSFIDDLERSYASIPVDKTVIVIPDTNPDGYLASTRVNANNIDLNRNFPTNDWTSGIYMPRNVFLELGGGTSPLSEPESLALASYTASLSPRVVLTFHATGRAVFANDAGDSKQLADIYAEKSGFTSFNSSDSNTFFSYPTTGEYEDWLRDKQNLPALLVELAGVSNNEFTRQKPALWAMLSI
jgi:murein peptide amidase A